jgi:hypothetical protein
VHLALNSSWSLAAIGYERLEDILSQCGDVDAETIKDYLMEALAIHCESSGVSWCWLNK